MLKRLALGLLFAASVVVVPASASGTTDSTLSEPSYDGCPFGGHDKEASAPATS